uniref:Tetratricopeptide repeat and ankyrin repeat containing 1 n=1 Tax=Pelodiscus sinensis TaxID=13735 RepID=K7FTE1_PELSI|nr:TPR and ankyrin repeat-containing protein 1 isoform X2 [Pelodiscus sinensis]|eukprot:XP_006124073.1 TPR and ankyrin repeat-containing protein 1 isoform X2 [Pelodiscus sinensis]
MDPMSYAEFMKKTGNDNFRNGNYFLAIRNYDEAIAVLFQLFQWRMVSQRDMAVLLCNKSNAFYSLGKWEEAFQFANESLQWDMSYVKGYYRSGYSLLQLSRTHDAVVMFSRGLNHLRGSMDQSQIADFLIGIFTCVNGEKYIAPYFISIFKNILNEKFDALVWQVVIEKLAKKGMWQSLMLLAAERHNLPRHLRVTHVSLKDLFEKYVLFGHYERMERVPELVEWLITIGVNVESIGAYPLHAIINLCIKAKGNRLFTRLLDEMPDLKGSINQQDQDGCTVLHVVASHSSGYPMKRQTENVQMLLNAGVDPTVPDAQARSATDILKKSKNFKAVDIINNHIARHASSSKDSAGKSKSKDSFDETSSLLDAFKQFLMFCNAENFAHHDSLKHERVQGFLKLLPDVKEIPEEMVCDIDDTCASVFIKFLLEKQMWHEVLLLLTRKANGEMPSCGGLIRHCSLSDLNIGNVIKQVDKLDKRRLHLVRCLLEKGASPDGTGAIPENPLQICFKNNDFELAYLLLSSGADPRSVSIVEGDTPLHAAVSICLDKRNDIGLNFLNYLLDLYGSNPSIFPHLNPNSQDKNGNTVMHIIFQKAPSKQVKKIMDLLAKFDINFNLKNKLGKDVRHRIKKSDPRLVTWNTAVSEKRKHRQDTVGQLVRLPKSMPVCNASQPKSTAHSSSAPVWRAPPGNSVPANTENTAQVPDRWEEAEDAQLTKQQPGEIIMSLTPRESLVKAITDLIQRLQLGENLKEENSQVPNPPLALTSIEGKKNEPQQICGYESLALSKTDGADSEKVEDTEEEHDKSDVFMPNTVDEETMEINGEIQDIEAYIQDFDNMTWEIECTSDMLKKLGSKAVPHYMKKKIILAVQQLGNGEWTQGLQKRLKHLKADIQLYEAKLDKGARMLWELAIDFSPRCSEAAEKIIETEQSLHPLEKSGRVYTEIIRIWDIVFDHCKLDRAISTICTAYNRGLSCILRKKLKGISKIKPSSNLKLQKRIPRCYVEDIEAEKTKEHIIPEYFPPASAVETEYNIMKFHSFSTNMAFNIISDMNSAVEYPFRVGELEYAVIDLNPKPMEPIILIGRSGTGKTTCCLYRLWKKFHSYWEKAQLAGAPLLVRHMWQRRKFEIASEKESREDEEEEEDEKQGNNDSNESIELESLDDEQEQDDGEQNSSAANTELNLLGDCEEEEEHSTEESDRLEHLHQIFVTKNHVLCQEVQRNFIELSKSSKSTSHFQPLESNVYKLQDIKDENYPLYVTSKQLLLLLDASMPDPFFVRNEDGSLKRTIIGWSTQEDLLIPNWQEEDEDCNTEGEYGEDEKPGEAHSRENDPRVFVTYDVFANEMWPKMTKGKNIYNPALVWKEIKSFLKGSFEALSCPQGKLTEEEYKKLGRKRSPNFKEDRSEIYRLFCLYQQIRSQRGYFDEEDVLYNLSQRLSKLEELPWSIHELYGDEIQDFTQAELALLMKCINDPNAMFLTGDTAQSIMKGVAFRFSDLRSLFHYANKNSVDKKQYVVRKPKRIYQLYQNYRSHSGILHLASGVVDLLQYYFPESFDRLPRDSGLFDGPKPTVLESCSVSDLAILLRGNKRKTQPIEFGAHQVILVANEMVKDKIPEELSLALVLTIYEAKGLEFDDVLLYNFFTDSEAYKEWKIISSFTPPSDSLEENKMMIETPLEKNISIQSRSPVLNPEMYKMLNGELKQLYTAITRARVNLWIFDENSDKRAPAFKYFIKREFVQVVKIDENKDLDDSMFVKTSTSEEWIAQGEYYAKHQCWKVAAKCYQKGGAIEKEKLALAHDAVLNVQSKKSSPKEKQMDYMYLAKTYLECGEPKLSLKCLIYAKEFQLCAELCEKLGKIKDAATFYKRSQCYRDASRCYEQIQEFDLALKMCCHEELYEEAAILVKRYEKILRMKRQPVSKLSYSANQFYLEAAAKYLRENKTKEMMAALSNLDTEDQLVFLKSRKCLAQAADLLKREGREEEAAKLMKQHGFVLEAAKLTAKKEFRASCLLAAVRFSLSGYSELEDRDTILEEALELCKQTNQKSSIAEAIFLQGVLNKDFKKLEEAFYKFSPLNHFAGVVEALFESTRCEPQCQDIFFLAPCGIEALLKLVRALQKATTNAEKEMVRSCFEYFGILRTDGSSVCQVSQNEAGRILQFLPDNPSLKEKKTKDHFSVGMEEVKSALNKHFLSRLCSITCSILEQSYPDICMKFIVGLKCEDQACKDFHRPLLRHEAKSILQSKVHLAAINGLLLEAKRVFPKELLYEFKDIDEILTADKYTLCKSLLDFVFPKHFHLRVMSENPKACKDILGLIYRFSKPCRTVLKEYIIFQFKSENAINRRESTDLWLRAMQVFILSSSYPEEFEKLLAKEEDDYNKELKLSETKKYEKSERGRGGRHKGLDGRYGMLIPHKNSENAENTHLCFIRLLENSLDCLYVYRNPEDCKRMFFRFMNVLVKKCIEPLIPSIGNTVMLLEFQYILCCAVLMRLCKNITLCLPKSYIALFHYWEFLFRKSQNKEVRDTFSIIQEYKSKDTNEAIKVFKFHLLYVAEVLCGAKNRNFNVLLDTFEDPDFITSGEAERAVVLCLVMIVNADQVLRPRCKSLLHEHFPEIKAKLINMKKECPSKVPERLVKIVERVNEAVNVRKIAEGLQELLIERDEEYLVDCHWKWETMYTKGASIRGIFYEQVNLDRFESYLEPLEYFEEPEMEREMDFYVEEREDPLTAIASMKQQKQQQKAHAKQKLRRLFLLAYCCIIWKRNSCSRRDPIGMEMKELVSGIFKKADIDQTQCDLCGVKFIQGPENYFIHTEDFEREASEAMTPTETDQGEKESMERRETVVANETYVKHKNLDEHRNKYTAYQNYFEFFKKVVDPKIHEGLDIVDTIEQNAWIKSHLIFKEHSNVVQKKIQENIKKISDIVEDVYKRKAWADAEEIMAKPVNSLSDNLDNARKWLKNTESHMVKEEEGFADDKDFENEGEDELAAFEELIPKKSSRKKGKRRK